MQTIALHNTQNGSDKVYQISIEPKDDGFMVNYAYGRRCSTPNTGTKTKFPVSLEAAKRIFDGPVNEKLAKGYVQVQGVNGSGSAGSVPAVNGTVQR